MANPTAVLRDWVPEATPIIPYADEATLDPEARAILANARAKAILGVTPNAGRTYGHRPDIARLIHAIYTTIVLSDLSQLDVALKNRLGVICSSINGCVHCTSYHAARRRSPPRTAASGVSVRTNCWR